MGGVPEESEEEKRARKRAKRRARAARIEQNQELTADRTAFLIRQFGARAGTSSTGPGSLRNAFRSFLTGRAKAASTGARLGSFSSGLFG